MADLEQLALAVARIETKQDAVLEKLDGHVQDTDKTFDDHENRVRSLERSKWTTHGITGVIATAVAGVVTFFKAGPS